MVYIDYENILELLKRYGKDPLELNFFPVIQAKLKQAGLKILDFTVYGNFEKQSTGNRQTFLRAQGLQTRHTSTNGKNSGDLELTVDALKDLYKNPIIDVFVIISSDRDIIPLLKEIKLENKFSYCISTRTGFNTIVTHYADYHEYIEDIFNISTPDFTICNFDLHEESEAIDPKTASPEDIARTREVARCFYNSHIWLRSSFLSKPVTVKGYANVLYKVVNRSPDQVMQDFRLAHQLKLITLYQDPERGLCIREGENKDELD